MGQLTEFLDNLQALYEQAEAAIFGDENTSATLNGQTRDSLAKAIKGKFDALQAMVQGRLAYETKAAMDAAGAPPAGELAEVWNDPALENNGLYGWDGSLWAKSPYDPAGAASDYVNSALSTYKKDLSVSVVGDSSISIEYRFNDISAVRWLVKHVVDAGRYLDIWYIDKMSFGTTLGGRYIEEIIVVSESAVEAAMKEVSLADYVASNNHGYEVLSEPPTLIIDGVVVDLSVDGSYTCAEVSLFEKSVVGTYQDSANSLCEIGKRFQFHGGGLVLHQNLEFMRSADMQYTYLGQLPINKGVFSSGILAPDFSVFGMPVDSTKGNNSRAKYFCAFNSLSSVSVTVETTSGQDFRGRIVDLNIDRDKFYPSHAGAGSVAYKTVSSGETIDAKSTYEVNYQRQSSSISGQDNLKARISSTARFSLPVIGLGFEAGMKFLVSAGDFDVGGILVNLDGAYEIQSIIEGTYTTEILIDTAVATAVSADWNQLSSTYTDDFLASYSN